MLYYYCNTEVQNDCQISKLHIAHHLFIVCISGNFQQHIHGIWQVLNNQVGQLICITGIINLHGFFISDQPLSEIQVVLLKPKLEHLESLHQNGACVVSFWGVCFASWQTHPFTGNWWCLNRDVVHQYSEDGRMCCFTNLPIHYIFISKALIAST